MRLLPKPKKHRKPKHITHIGFLPKTRKFNGVIFTKHATVTSSKVEASQKVKALREQGRMARKLKTKEGYAIYSRDKNV